MSKPTKTTPKAAAKTPNNTLEIADSRFAPAKNKAGYQFDYLVFIGRFQPFHLGHKAVIDEALNLAENVIMLIGSANLPRSTRNSFSVSERTDMILGAYDKAYAKRIHCVGLDDALYNDTRWLQYVQQGVKSVTVDLNANIGLIGHSKDSSSYYLSLFPNWQSVGVPNFMDLSATPIREGFLLGADPLPDVVPASTAKVMKAVKTTEDYKKLHKEAGFIDKYKKQWESAPYPPTFMTVDAVVIQSGHILLVERRSMPGQGLWALPGGFIDGKETLFDACLRELREETRLKVPEAVLRGSRHSQHTFDDPYRSARGRTITQAFYFVLKSDPKGLPAVKGGDDAKKAFWLPLAELKADKLFEDHYAIITKMMGL